MLQDSEDGEGIILVFIKHFSSFFFERDFGVFVLFLVQNNSRNTPSVAVNHTKLDFAPSYWFLLLFSLFILGESPCWTYRTWTEVLGSTEGTDTEITEVASLKNKQNNCMTDIWCRFKCEFIRKMLRLKKTNRFLPASCPLLLPRLQPLYKQGQRCVDLDLQTIRIHLAFGIHAQYFWLLQTFVDFVFWLCWAWMVKDN